MMRRLWQWGSRWRLLPRPYRTLCLLWRWWKWSSSVKIRRSKNLIPWTRFCLHSFQPFYEWVSFYYFYFAYHYRITDLFLFAVYSWCIHHLRRVQWHYWVESFLEWLCQKCQELLKASKVQETKLKEELVASKITIQELKAQITNKKRSDR